MRATSSVPAAVWTGSESAVTRHPVDGAAPSGKGAPPMVLFGDQSVTTLALELDHIVGMQFVEQSRFRLTSQPLSWIAPGRVLRNAAAIRLIEGWLADDSGYDEAVWPSVKAAIEENRMSSRRRFRE